MSRIGQRERLTQQQVLRFAANRNVEKYLLCDWLLRQGFDERIISRALRKLDADGRLAWTDSRGTRFRALQKARAERIHG